MQPVYLWHTLATIHPPFSLSFVLSLGRGVSLSPSAIGAVLLGRIACPLVTGQTLLPAASPLRGSNSSDSDVGFPGGRGPGTAPPPPRWRACGSAAGRSSTNWPPTWPPPRRPSRRTRRRAPRCLPPDFALYCMDAWVGSGGLGLWWLAWAPLRFFCEQQNTSGPQSSVINPPISWPVPNYWNHLCRLPPCRATLSVPLRTFS